MACEIFKLQTGLWKGHAHNLPLELMVSYGVPAGLLIIIPVVLLLTIAIKKLFKIDLFGMNDAINLP